MLLLLKVATLERKTYDTKLTIDNYGYFYKILKFHRYQLDIYFPNLKSILVKYLINNIFL